MNEPYTDDEIELARRIENAVISVRHKTTVEKIRRQALKYNDKNRIPKNYYLECAKDLLQKYQDELQQAVEWD